MDSLQPAASIFITSLEMPFSLRVFPKKCMQSSFKLHFLCDFLLQGLILSVFLVEEWEALLKIL